MRRDDGFGEDWGVFAIAPRHDASVDEQLRARGVELVRAPDGSVFEPQAFDDVGELTDDEACALARRAGFHLVRVPDTPRSPYWSTLVAEPWPGDSTCGGHPGVAVCGVEDD